MRVRPMRASKRRGLPSASRAAPFAPSCTAPPPSSAAAAVAAAASGASDSVDEGGDQQSDDAGAAGATSISESEDAAPHRVLDIGRASDVDARGTRVATKRRKQNKAPSAVVPRTLVRATKDVKRRRVSVASEERRLVHLGLLQTAFSSEDDGLDDTSWLTSTLMDLMLWRLASQYPGVHFLPTDFFHCFLESRSRSRTKKRSHKLSNSSSHTPRSPSDSDFRVRDVLGRPVDYGSDRPLLFAVNCGRIHWNLFRVQLTPQPELQLFEPMGRLASRSGLSSYRCVPRSVVEWLEACYPQHRSWISRAVTAITAPQQVSGFDCGVACLLYADKCGQGQTRQEIDARTDQRAITGFRATLQQQLREMMVQSGEVLW